MRWVTVATVGSGVLAYLVMLIAAMTLPADRFTTFIVLWSLCFAAIATLQGFTRVTASGVRRAGVQQGRPVIDANDNGIDDAEELVISSSPLGLTVIEDRTADEILAGRDTSEDRTPAQAAPAQRGTKPLIVALWVGTVVAVLAGALSPLWAPLLLVGMTQPLATVLFSLAAGLVVLQSALSGLLSGTGRWNAFSWLLGAEAIVRIGAVVVGALAGDIMSGLMYAAIAGGIVTPIVLLATPDGRASRNLETDLPLGKFLLQALLASLRSAVPSVLIVGASAMLRFLRPDIDLLVLGNLLLALTIVRAALLTPVTSFQNAIMSWFRARLHLGLRMLLVPLLFIVIVGIPVSLLLWLGGPVILHFIGPSYQLSGDTILQLCYGALATSMLYVTSGAVRARRHYRADLAGWITALVVTMVVLVSVRDPLVATTAALLSGPVAGMLVHLFGGMHTDPLPGTEAQTHPAPEPAVSDTGATRPAAAGPTATGPAATTEPTEQRMSH